ncbi:hypothetical protein Btru_042928 [Bulinus truncatus]|nr:hypothetical protein Btru_042928 [Bulinus truncatus]
MNKNVTLARQANFISSSSFMGRHYWLPKMTTSYFSYIYAQAACMNFGGYLAEVNSKDELEFLRNFLRQNGREFTSFCLGGTYLENEVQSISIHVNMKSVVAIILLILLTGVQSDSNPVITINPNVVNVGLTETLEVKCTFRQRAEQIFERISSLVLLHSRISNEEHFCVLVSVSNTSVLENGTALQDPYETSGLINDTGDSFVKISWKNPGKDRAGFYKCEVRMDNVTDGIEPASISMSLQADSPSIDMVVSEMRKIQDSLKDQLKSALSRVNQLEKHVSDMKEYEISIHSNSLSNLHTRVRELETKTSEVKTYQDSWKSKIEASRKALFISSDIYQNRYYLLTISPSSFFSWTYAQATCITNGGYLAELDSEDELTFLRGFLNSVGKHYDYVFLGGTDLRDEGNWRNRFEDKIIPNLKWQSGQPDNDHGNEHCLSLTEDSKWGMNDLYCYLTDYDRIGFVCEIAA